MVYITIRLYRNDEFIMKEYRNKTFTGERALFQGKDLELLDCTFMEGESPLKESENIQLTGARMKWKYPLWYSKHITVKNSVFFEMARAGVWYTDDVVFEDVMIEAPKEFRRCHGVVLKHVTIPNADETLWHCQNVTIEHVMAKGNYFAMNSENMKLDHFTLYGNYSFDGAKNVEIHNARIMSKDFAWNSENVTIYDSYISGEYLGWNAKNLTLVNCTVESLQGFCYIDNLVIRNCKLINTTLAFEYCTVEADIVGGVDSVLNPSSGTIRADHIGELILEKDKVDATKTTIIYREQGHRAKAV